jgi:hypothetical protein
MVDDATGRGYDRNGDHRGGNPHPGCGRRELRGRSGVLTTGPFGIQIIAAQHTSSDDGLLVYCLSADHRPALVEAARNLGVVTPDSTLTHVVPAPGRGSVGGTVDDWRTQHPTDFWRSCTALASAQDPSSLTQQGGLVDPLVSALAPVLVGVLITAAVGEWLNAQSRGRERAAVVRTTFHTAVRAVDDYVDRWSGDGSPTMDELGRTARARLADLRFVVATAATGRRHRATVSRIRTTLDTEPLGDALTRNWRGNRSGVPARQTAIRGTLQMLARDVGDLASALETPHRFHWRTATATHKDTNP